MHCAGTGGVRINRYGACPIYLVCESGDTFAKRRDMPRLSAGEMVAFRSAGAYGAVMSSEYNSRPLIPEVLVKGDQFAVIRPRPTFDEMINRDTIPKWVEGYSAAT